MEAVNEAEFARRLTEAATATEALLELLLRPQTLQGEIARPARLLEAMRYATLGGGKRLRPFLVMESARLLGVEREGRARVGCASKWCIAIRWSMTICRRWTTTTCAAADPPCIRPSTRRRRSSPATRCSPTPSRCWPIRRRIPKPQVRADLLLARPARAGARRHGRRPDARSRRRNGCDPADPATKF